LLDREIEEFVQFLHPLFVIGFSRQNHEPLVSMRVLHPDAIRKQQKIFLRTVRVIVGDI